MGNNQIRIYPKLRKPVDAERLAAALLHLIDNLNEADRDRLIVEGQRALEEVKGQAKPKGSAA